MTLKTERRTQLRKRPLSLVYVELPPANGGMMRDLSEQGFSLRAMMPLRPSEKIPFSFALEGSARIDGEAIVLRVEDGGHVAAMEFAGLPAHFRDQIRRWLDKFDEPFSPESEPAQPSPVKHTSLTELRSKIRIRKQPSEASPVAESAPPPTPPPPQAMAAPPKVEPAAPPLAPTPEIAPPTPPASVQAPPEPEPQATPLSPVVASAPSASPIASAPPDPEPPPAPPAVEPALQPPPPAVMALPKRFPPRPREKQPAPVPTVSPTTVEQPDTPSLPPLLKLSSVRPGPLPAEIPAEPVAPVAIPEPIVEALEKIQISVSKPEPPVATETRIPVPAPAPRRLIPPPLEPLSSFERETDSDNPSWMDSFTLTRAVGIMLFLTLLAGSYVYHRELGQAIIWFGHQIAGDESPESSKAARPEIPSVTRTTPPATPAPRSVETPPPSSPKSPEISEAKSANLPAAADSTPAPQLKDTTPGSLVPLTQVTKPSAQASPADNSAEAGQQEYLEALQILRSPSRTSEAPAAIQLLWAAVEKGNTSAEIDLAELFRIGKGVARNCDQARILLSAASRKGSVEARKRLESLRREGCGN